MSADRTKLYPSRSARNVKYFQDVEDQAMHIRGLIWNLSPGTLMYSLQLNKKENNR